MIFFSEYSKLIIYYNNRIGTMLFYPTIARKYFVKTQT